MILTFMELQGARRARDLVLMWRRRVLNVLILVSVRCYLTVTLTEHIHAHFLFQNHSETIASHHQKYNQTRNFVMMLRVSLSECFCTKIIKFVLQARVQHRRTGSAKATSNRNIA